MGHSPNPVDPIAISPFAAIDQKYRAVFDAVNDGIFISNPLTGRLIEVNQAGCHMFGYEIGDLLGQDIEILSSGVHPYTQEMAIAKSEKALLGGTQTFEWHCRRRDNVLFWAEVSVRITKFGSTPAMVANVRDITERKNLNAQVEHMAHYDALTGLANRSMFTNSLDRAIARAHCTGETFALLLLDLDHFKDVNDTRGHPAGDRLLQAVGERLQAGVRADGSVFRLGGDEFGILPGYACDEAEIGALADRLIASVGKPIMIDGVEVHVDASIGMAIYRTDIRNADTLMSHADIALYQAKADGRQTCRFYSPEMAEAVQSRVALTDELRLAIQDSQLFLVYQPQVRAETGSIIGVEALVRWAHPRRGILAPACFLPVAESSGLIVALDRWVLREACRQARQWIDAGIAPGNMCVNLSSAHFKQPLEFERFVSAVLDETGLPAHVLELEITESTLLQFSSEHADMVQRLRKAGVRFALDDFGTGYSSLNCLRLRAVDRIKIAREFVAELATSAEAATIVECIIRLTQDLGHEVVAEGVEMLEQSQLLQARNCQDAQGFYFASPMTAEAVSPLLTTGTIGPRNERS